MKVLICTMAYNAEKTISRAIDSIRNQTFPHWEYFILDNGSTDRTWEILNEYARRDRRVMPMRIEKNDPAHGGLFLRALPLVSDAGYFVWLDAGDAYSPDFLEKMVSFAEENRLDIAACGHDRMDGLSGRLLKRRVSPENLVLHGAEFEKRFVDYRAFLTTVWGKLYSVPFFKKALGAEMAPHRAVFVMYGDSIFVQELFQKAERAGVYGEAMYQYYQYPRSLSRDNLQDRVTGSRQYFQSTREYLEHYGPISQRNEDFLYAIYLSLADETAEYVFESSQPAGEKLELLRSTFAEPFWAETLARKAAPEFRNLAARQEYVTRMKERIRALASTPQERALAEEAVRELDKPIAVS